MGGHRRTGPRARRCPLGHRPGAVLALAALLRLGRGGAWVPWAAAVGLVLPIGMLAHDNGGSPWLWALWALVAFATAGWVRNGHEVKQG